MKDIYFPKLAGQLADLYLEWWNDWLTLERFAEYHGVSVDDAEALINMGRQYHDQRAARIKEVEAAQRDNDTGITLRGASEAHDQAKAEMIHEALPCPPIPNLETGDIMRVHDDFYLNYNRTNDVYRVQHKFEYMGQYGSVGEAMDAIEAKIAEVDNG